MNIQLTLAARYLKGRKLRTTLTTMAIMFGVLVVFGINTLLPAMTQAFQINLMAAAGQVDATITLKASAAFPARVMEQVAGVEGVRAVSGSIKHTVNVLPNYYDADPSLPDAISALDLIGIVPNQANTVRAFLIQEGRMLTAEDTKSAVISQSLADAAGVKLGDALPLPAANGETDLTIVGLLPTHAMPGNEEVLVTLPQAQAMLDMSGEINMVEANFDTLDEVRRQEIESNILAVLGDTYQMGSLSSNSELITNLYIVQAMFNMMGALALLMGGFIIFNTFRTIVVERRRDIGMLRALGANRRTILGIILSEGVAQGVVGTAAGLLMGYVLAYGMLRMLGPVMMQYMNVQIGTPVVTPGLVIGSVVLGIGVTLLAGLLPAISAARFTPLEALRPPVEKITLKRMTGIGFWAGVVMIGLAMAALLTQDVALIGVGGVLFITGLALTATALVAPVTNLFSALLALVFARSGTAQLAQGNLARQPTRAVTTGSTTMISMAILVMAASFIVSASTGFTILLRKSLGSDYLLIPPSVGVWGTNVGANTGLADDLRQIDGVAIVSTLRFAPTLVNEVSVSVLGIEPQNYTQVSGLNFSEGDEKQAYASLTQGRNLIINNLLATSAGVKMGQAIELITPSGRQEYTVTAIAGDFLNAKIATAYLSQANMAADFYRDEDVLIQVNVAPGVELEEVEPRLKTLLKAYPQFRLVAGEAYIEENMKLFEMAFAGMIGIVAFLGVPSVIAMVNTLAIGVIERTREIGMLRAVGSTRAQIRTIITAEALILATIGTTFGVLVGLYLGYMAVNVMELAGFPMTWAFPFSEVMLAIAAGIIFGVLAAIIPARQAARLEIVQALRYE